MASTMPFRRKARDFANREFSLPDAANAWRLLTPPRDNSNILVLGLGPHGVPPLEISPGKSIFWLDAPETLASLQISPPPDWRMVKITDIPVLAVTCSIYFYTPGLRLAPQFWSNILARIDLSLNCGFAAKSSHAVWLPGDNNMLLHQELKQALQSLGYAPIIDRIPGTDAKSISAAFGGLRPQLGICVNFRGLDGQGMVFSICNELKIPIAVWLVDNPWNLLQAVQLPWWKDCPLFVTDASFVEELRAYGAKHVFFLPLAASLHMQNGCMAGAVKTPPLFVGRSAFPDRAGFFAGVKRNEKLWRQAIHMLDDISKLPDFHWWSAKCNELLWPGKGERQAARGAEDCSRLRRALWLADTFSSCLRIVGDDGWRLIFPDAPICPPVDYYGSLPGLYAGAECCLNITSLLLPQSLSQRHFDVWLAGGFLLSDPTPGLCIFPADLVKPMRLATRKEFVPRLEALRQNPVAKTEISRAWQAEVFARHLYAHRLTTIIETLGSES